MQQQNFRFLVEVLIFQKRLKDFLATPVRVLTLALQHCLIRSAIFAEKQVKILMKLGRVEYKNTVIINGSFAEKIELSISYTEPRTRVEPEIIEKA